MSDTGEVVVVATIVPQAEQREDVKEALTHAIRRVHNEDEGCLLYALHENPDGFVMIEKWKDAETLKAHSQSEGFLELQGALKGRLAGAPEVKFLTPLPAGTDGQGTL
jgi:quinol monooxygenase YgiN